MSIYTTESEERVFETRKAKARMVARRLGGQKELAKALGRDPSQISSIIGRNPRERIGPKMARLIEKAANEPTGWLDESEQKPIDISLADTAFVTSVLDMICEVCNTNGLDAPMSRDVPGRKIAAILYNASLAKEANADDEDRANERIRGLIELAIT